MIKMRTILLAIIFVGLSQSFADFTSVTTDEFALVEKKAIEMGEQYGVDKVLLVFDIDNTLLAMKQDLGSDQWFTWQSDSKKVPADQLVAKDMSELVEITGRLISYSKMRPTQPDAPQILKNLQDRGFKTIALTARGSEIRNATERALAENGYFFNRTIGPDKGYPGTYMPYDLKDMEDTSGMTNEEATALSLSEPRAVSFQNGIFMGNGQHKGAMLRALLEKTDYSPKAILFSDDHEKHTINVGKAYSTTDKIKKNTQVFTYRYSREDPAVKKFHAGSKVKVTQQWKRLKTVLDQTFAK
jgi:hypothetical protein